MLLLDQNQGEAGELGRKTILFLKLWIVLRYGTERAAVIPLVSASGASKQSMHTHCMKGCTLWNVLESAREDVLDSSHMHTSRRNTRDSLELAGQIGWV